MRILNFFRKNKKPKSVVKPDYYYTINNKDWAVEDSINFQTQGIVEGMKPYGWAIEVRWKDSKGELYPWETSWNRKIYHSAVSASEAALKCYLSKNHGYEWRLKPLYSMEQQEYRSFKLDKLLNVNRQEPKKYEIKGWKVKEDTEIVYDNGVKAKYKKGTLFIQMENGSVFRINGTSDKTYNINLYQFRKDLITNENVIEVEIKDEKWSHPHLLKELKTKLKLK